MAWTEITRRKYRLTSWRYASDTRAGEGRRSRRCCRHRAGRAVRASAICAPANARRHRPIAALDHRDRPAPASVKGFQLLPPGDGSSSAPFWLGRSRRLAKDSGTIASATAWLLLATCPASPAARKSLIAYDSF